MTVTLQRSRGLLLYLLLAHGLAGILISMLSLNGVLIMLLDLLLVVSLLLSCRRYGCLDEQAVISQFHCDGDGRWFLQGIHSHKEAWRLRNSVILGPLMLLSFSSKAQKRMQPVLVIRDAVDAETWRQLCLRLRDPESWG